MGSGVGVGLGSGVSVSVRVSWECPLLLVYLLGLNCIHIARALQVSFKLTELGVAPVIEGAAPGWEPLQTDLTLTLTLTLP